MISLVPFSVFKVRSYLLPMRQQKKQWGQLAHIQIRLPFSPLVSPLPVHPQVHLIAYFSRCFQCYQHEHLYSYKPNKWKDGPVWFEKKDFIISFYYFYYLASYCTCWVVFQTEATTYTFKTYENARNLPKQCWRVLKNHDTIRNSLGSVG